MKKNKEQKKEESAVLKTSISDDVKFCSASSFGVSTITTSTSNIVIGSSNEHAIGNLMPSNSVWISPNHGAVIQKQIVQKILDGEIELESLVDKNLTETYEISEMRFEKSNSNISCKREIDLNYLDQLELRNELLLEFMPVPQSRPSIDNTFWINNDWIYTGNPTLAGGTGTITVNPNYWVGTITTNNFNWTGTDTTIQGRNLTVSNSGAVTV